MKDFHLFLRCVQWQLTILQSLLQCIFEHLLKKTNAHIFAIDFIGSVALLVKTSENSPLCSVKITCITIKAHKIHKYRNAISLN